MAKLLKRWGFTAQKPAFRAYEQSPWQVRRWLKEQYPAIRRKAQRQHGLIFWLDETGMRSGHQAGATYAKKGKTPVLKKTGKRFSLHMISAITNGGRMVFMVVDGRFNGAVFVRFLQQLVKSTRQKLFLIADNHPVHLQKTIMQWTEHQKGKIELFFLPTYSPELNPDEYFNQDVKTNVVGKSRPGSKKELKKAVEAFSNAKKTNPHKIKRYFHAKPVKYAAKPN